MQQKISNIDITMLRRRALEIIQSPPLYRTINCDCPPGVKLKDIHDAVWDLSAIDLLTKNGNLAGRKVIIKRCIRIVALKGQVDENVLRKKVVNAYSNKIKKIKLRGDSLNSAKAVSYYFQNDSTVETLLSLFDGCSINLDKLFRYTDSLMAKIKK